MCGKAISVSVNFFFDQNQFWKKIRRAYSQCVHQPIVFNSCSTSKKKINKVIKMMNDLAGMIPYDTIGLYEQPKPRFFFKMPRVVPEQKSKFESDELFRRLSRECEVSKRTVRNRPIRRFPTWKKIVWLLLGFTANALINLINAHKCRAKSIITLKKKKTFVTYNFAQKIVGNFLEEWIIHADNSVEVRGRVRELKFKWINIRERQKR